MRSQPSHQPPADKVLSLPDIHRQGGNILPRFIKAEANLLKLPLFALQTKGLRSLEGIECRGTGRRNNESYDFTLKATRNTATLYPGPLARKAHLAMLSIATEGKLPIDNPVSWSFRDLCRRMRISYSGREVQQLRAAITSTAGLLIKSQFALYSKADQRLIRTQEEALHLYDRVAFVGSQLPDGRIADANYVWLAGWYVDNLNAMYTAPLNYELWHWLESKSQIASRLYEYLLLNFFSGMPVLSIHYEKLAQLLPVRAEKYLSKAKEQLGPALSLLSMVGILEAARWTEGKSGIAVLRLHRGSILPTASNRSPIPADFTEDEAIEVKEIHNPKPPEHLVVSDFYRLWEGNEAHRPSKKELEQAKELIEQQGLTKARDLIGRAVKRLRIQWPDAKTFGAVQPYLPAAIADYEREQRHKEVAAQEQLAERQAGEERMRLEAERLKFAAVWRPMWESLSDAGREAIRDAAFTGANRYFRSGPAAIAERLCLIEVARQHGVEIPAEILGA